VEEPVSLKTCRELYDGCGNGDEVTITTKAGSVKYDLWCPCFDSEGSNVPDANSDLGTLQTITEVQQNNVVAGNSSSGIAPSVSVTSTETFAGEDFDEGEDEDVLKPVPTSVPGFPPNSAPTNVEVDEVRAGGVSGDTCTDTAPCSTGLTCCNWDNAAGAASKAGTCGEVCTLSVGETSPIVDDEICPVRCGEGTVEKDGVCYGVRNTQGGDTTTCAHYNWPTKYTPKNQCQCNDLCKKYNNCCSDHAHEKSCGNRGHPNHYMPNASCQCNDLCVRYGNCCSDSHHNN
jgi:hypothetical protein